MLFFILPLLVASASALTANKDSRCVRYTAESQAMTLTHKTDCTKFYMCDGEGYAQELRCPDGLFYSAKEGVCTFDSSECAGSTGNNKQEQPKPENPIKKPDAPVIDNGFKTEQDFLKTACMHTASGVTLPLVDDCRSYVVCLQQKPIILTCPEGLAYDHGKTKCEVASRVQCGSNGQQHNRWEHNNASPHHQMPLFSDMEALPALPAVNVFEPANPVYPMPQLPVQFPQNPIIMTPEVPEQQPQDPIFSMPSVPVQEVPLQHPEEDPIFSMPHAPPMQPMQPQPYEAYQTDMSYLPYGTVVLYSDSRCVRQYDPLNPVLLPHASDCSKFYICVGHDAIEKSCPEGQHWSVEQKWCDFPTRAQCVL